MWTPTVRCWRSIRGRSTWRRGVQFGGILVRIKRRGLADRRWPGALRSLPRTPRSDPRGAVGPGRPRRRGHRLTRTTTRTLLCCSGLGGLEVARASGAIAGRPSSLHDAPILARQPCRIPRAVWHSVPAGAPLLGTRDSQPQGRVSPAVNLWGHRSTDHRPEPVGTCREATGMPTPGGRGGSPGVVATRRVQRLGSSVGPGPPPRGSVSEPDAQIRRW